MFMVASSVVTTIMILNFHHRKPETHSMPDWVGTGTEGLHSNISALDTVAVSQLDPLAVENEKAGTFSDPEDFADETKPGGAAGKFQLCQSALRCSRHG